MGQIHEELLHNERGKHKNIEERGLLKSEVRSALVKLNRQDFNRYAVSFGQFGD